MTIELRPLGVKCNIQCQYCYQNPLRDAGNVPHSYDLDTMLAAVEQEGDRFALFGGEPLLIPLDDLETLWKWGHERYGSNSVQTNGVLIRDEHIELFRKYNVRVGISVDGPEDLNDARWAGSLKRTREATAGIQATIERLCEEGMPPGLIVTLHRGNAIGERLTRMNEWIRQLEQTGVCSIVLHILEVDHEEIGHEYELTTQENLIAFRNFSTLANELTSLRIRIFDDLRDLLLGNDQHVDCVWNACDSYTTRAVRGIEGNGQRSNCGRVNKEGIEFTKGDVEGFERYIALYTTPQEHGGCQDCRFFLMCKGQCPGTATDGDWRNRTQYCEVWMELFEEIESRLISAGETPLSVSPIRRDVEKVLLENWAMGRHVRLVDAVEQVAGVTEFDSTRETEQVAAAVRCSLPQENRQPVDFELPAFTRIVWVSDDAKRVWAPRVARLQSLWTRIETLSVADNVRRCATLNISAEQSADLTSLLQQRGLELQTLSGQRVSLSSEWQPGPYVVGRDSDLAQFENARRSADQQAISQLLGYPPCCHDFLRRAWRSGARQDPIWPMAIETGGNGQTPVIDLRGPAQANTLLRPAGIQAVPHWPCRSDCEPTVTLADQLIECGRRGGNEEEMDWLLELLSWPVEWSARFGIAEIRTPVLKISTRTDVSSVERIVRRRSESYPVEGAQGVRFPYAQSNERLFTLSSSYQRGLEHARSQNTPIESELRPK